MKVLVVEDQEGPIQGFKFSLAKAFKEIDPLSSNLYEFEIGYKNAPFFTQPGSPSSIARTFHLAKWYSQADEFIQTENYDLIFLDHRMPLNNPGFTDQEDSKRFSSLLSPIGYSLIPQIKKYNPKAVIVGTSSESSSIGNQFLKPDYTIKKEFNMTEEIKRVLRESKLIERLK